MTPERPLTHDLFVATLEALGARVDQVVISDLADETFHARIVVQIDGRSIDIDARPSDALAVAVRTGVAIFASETVLEQAGLGAEGGLTDDEESEAGARRRPPFSLEQTGERIADARLEVFRDFVNSLDVDQSGGETREGPKGR
jgi:bifunctional DNase/RNase